jgi:hypothetical protein
MRDGHRRALRNVLSWHLPLVCGLLALSRHWELLFSQEIGMYGKEETKPDNIAAMVSISSLHLNSGLKINAFAI